MRQLVGGTNTWYQRELATSCCKLMANPVAKTSLDSWKMRTSLFCYKFTYHNQWWNETKLLNRCYGLKCLFFSKAFLYVVLKACWDIGVFSIHPGRVSEIHCTCPRDNHSRIPLVQLSGSKISSQPYRGWSVQCTVFLSRCVPIDCCISHEDWHFQSPGPRQGSVGKILHLWSQLPSSSMEQRECVWETRDGSSLVKWDVISF